MTTVITVTITITNNMYVNATSVAFFITVIVLSGATSVRGANSRENNAE